MKKILTKFAVALFALCAVFACALAAACSGSGDTTEGEAEDYIIYILNPDGTKLDGTLAGEGGALVRVQICGTEDGAVCYMLTDVTPDKDGRVAFSQTTVDANLGSGTTHFMFHILNVANAQHDCEIEVNGAGTYTLTLTAASASAS